MKRNYIYINTDVWQKCWFKKPNTFSLWFNLVFGNFTRSIPLYKKRELCHITTCLKEIMSITGIKSVKDVQIALDVLVKDNQITVEYHSDKVFIIVFKTDCVKYKPYTYV